MKSTWDEITGRVEAVWSQRGGRGVAVFDADGTLWGDDLGERHLEILARHGHIIPTASHASILDEYQARCEADVDAGYGWAVACMEGLAESDVIGAAIMAWGAHRHLVPDEIGWLLRWLEVRDIEVWLVSASNRWAIETGAAELGVPVDRVIALSVDVDDGVLGGEVHTPLSNGAGKAALIKSRIGAVPLLAVGNSQHDMAMLKEADVGVVLRLAGGDGALPERCPILDQGAATHGWLQRDLPAG